jgi:hypothetical protein
MIGTNLKICDGQFEAQRNYRIPSVYRCEPVTKVYFLLPTLAVHYGDFVGDLWRLRFPQKWFINFCVDGGAVGLLEMVGSRRLNLQALHEERRLIFKQLAVEIG